MKLVFYDLNLIPGRYEIRYLELSRFVTYPKGLACNESLWMVPNLVNPYE